MVRMSTDKLGYGLVAKGDDTGQNLLIGPPVTS